jgi:hypothetical protein
MAELGPRVALNLEQIAKVAELIRALPDVEPFAFVGPDFPPVGHPAALDYFFAATLQQFGFWEMEAGKYHGPMVASLDGVPRKGSDYLWRAYLRPLDQDVGFYALERQARLTREALLALFRADDGADPMPALDLHLQQAQAYGQDMLALGSSPQHLIAQANTADTPLQAFLESLACIGGYKEDPLHKKANLLSLVLSQRPEKFLRPSAGEAIPPVIDYHLMRSCLRIGLVEILDRELESVLIQRREVSPTGEGAVRRATYEAILQIVEQSGKSTGAVDWFFFNARLRCPEITEPECPQCPVDPVCVHRTRLFQPVMRTSFY